MGSRKTEYGRDPTLLDDASLTHILAAVGCSKLRVLALYRHQDMRTRMQRLLAYHFNQPHLADGMPDDEIVQLGCHTEVLLHRAPELLSHGSHHDRRGALTNALPGLEAEDTGSWPWSRPSTTPRTGAVSGAPPAAGRTAPSPRTRWMPSRRSPATSHVTA
ncbi:hypothetical protein AB0H07_47535 [Streptomyces sp. NPDC021354]|uniref:hypothetical protein n=1 Tax=Streptomyces sp. NPDC021354 TaxID=3154793 RepID=UPI0033C79DB9